MSHVFISYSRRDLAFAQKIVDELAANDLDTWIDWKSIPKGEDWEQEIYRGIEEADVFLFLISPDSVASQMCNKEIAHAVKNGKRILPIFIANVDDRGMYGVTEKFLHKEQKEEISRRNFIKCREGRDDFSRAIEEIQKTIHTDYEWVRYHTELQVKAIKWEQKKDASRLLRGKELREAEEQLSKAGSQKDPQPTELLRSYVLASQRNEVHQRRQITIGLSTGLVIVAVLAIFSLIQRNTAQAEKERAEEQTTIAVGNRIVVQADQVETIDLKLLLCIQGYQLAPSSDALSCIFDQLDVSPIQGPFGIQLEKIVHLHEVQITALAVDKTGDYLFSGSSDGVIGLWNISDNMSLENVCPIQFGEITGLGVSPNSNSIAISDKMGFLALADIADCEVLWEQRTSPINALLFDYSGDTIITGSGSLNIIDHDNGEILFWNTEDGQMVGKQIGELQYPVTSLALSPNGQVLVSGFYQVGGFNVLGFWNMQTRDPLGDTISAHSNAITGLDYSPNGEILATGAISPGSASEGGDIILWNSQTLEPLWKLEDFPRHAGRMSTKSPQVNSLVFSRDGNVLYSNWGVNSSVIAAWDVSNFVVSNSYEYNSLYSVEKLAISPDGLNLFAGMSNGEILVLNIGRNSFKPIRQLLNEEQVLLPEFATKVRFVQDENSLLSWGNGGITMWSIETGEGQVLDENFQISSSGLSIGVDDNNNQAISSINRIAARVAANNSIALWDIEANEQIGNELSGHNDVVEKMIFTPDGRYLVSSAFRDKIIVWDVNSHTKLLEHGIPVQWVDSISVSSDSKYIAIAMNTAPKFGGQSELLLINIDSDLWINAGCELANRNLSPDEWQQFLGNTLPYQPTCPNLPIPTE